VNAPVGQQDHQPPAQEAMHEASGNVSTTPRVSARLRHSASKYTIFWVLVVAVVVVALTNGYFATTGNLQSVLLQASYVGIAASGMTLLLIVGDFDLSVGSTLSLCSIATASAVNLAGVWPGLVAALVVGAILGAVNGLIVTKLKIPTLVATLGTMYVFLAGAFIVTGDHIKAVTTPAFLRLAYTRILGIPVPFVVMLVVAVACAGVLHGTNYGRLVRAIGSNRRAAVAAGLPVALIRWCSFVLVAVCVAIAAFLQTSQLSSATPTVGTGFELNVIATVILGGTALSGGRGSLFGTVCAAIFFTVLTNALNLYHVGSYWQYIAVGSVIVLALALDSARNRFLGTKI
jgi:ribose/xylose/arabinose/galactoside ABC-type transport system permease subunit